jgi:hypothetical protein
LSTYIFIWNFILSSVGQIEDKKRNKRKWQMMLTPYSKLKGKLKVEHVLESTQHGRNGRYPP